MDLSILTDEELLRLASYQREINNYIFNEWMERYNMSFPYQLINNKIFNSILVKTMKDSECDRFIVEQAEDLRER